MNNKINNIINNISPNVFLYQETQDQEQLNPKNRLLSIYNVMCTVYKRIGNVSTAIDIGSGFGYGVLILDALGIKTIGVENISLKHTQALKLFSNLKSINVIDFDQTPGLLNQDFLEINPNIKVDLLTTFYTSEYFTDEIFLLKYKELLNSSGRILVSTQIDSNDIRNMIKEKSYINKYFDVEIIDIKNNFEKTAIILKSLK